jgi:hypothetical protein
MSSALYKQKHIAANPDTTPIISGALGGFGGALRIWTASTTIPARAGSTSTPAITSKIMAHSSNHHVVMLRDVTELEEEYASECLRLADPTSKAVLLDMARPW